MFVFLAECVVVGQSAVCSLSLHEDLSVIERDEWFGVLSSQDLDTQVSVHILPFVSRKVSNGNFKFQQDNDTKHTSRYTLVARVNYSS